MTSIIGCILLISACTSGDNSMSSETSINEPTLMATPTYHKDIRPLIESHCQSCHTNNGIGTFTLSTFADTEKVAAAVVSAVMSKRMPPWLPSKDCRHYVGERGLSDQEISLFQAWHQAGSPEGNVSDYTSASSPALEADLGPPSMQLQAIQSYTPKTDRPDDYRCFLLPQVFDKETYLLTSAIEPEITDQVHHVIVYLVEEFYVEPINKLSGQDSEPGYECFGGIGTGNPTFISGWAPGNKVQMIDPKVAMRLPSGSRLVMQMHYNTLAGSPKADRSTLKLWLSEERPEFLLSVRPFPHFWIEIDALDPASKHSRTFRNTSEQPWTVVATAPHMHLIGKEISVTVLHSDGTEECLVEIDRWDFSWQQSYSFLPDEIVTIEPGESVRLDCLYNNSPENQPIVNQQRQESKPVQWGEGSLDEMCLNYLVMIEPYYELPTTDYICNGFQDCYDTCQIGFAGTTTGCTLECSNRSGEECTQCAVAGLITCGVAACPVTTSHFLQCIETCRATSAPDCLKDDCINQLLVFERCISPEVEAGHCDDHIVGCQIDLKTK